MNRKRPSPGSGKREAANCMCRGRWSRKIIKQGIVCLSAFATFVFRCTISSTSATILVLVNPPAAQCMIFILHELVLVLQIRPQLPYGVRTAYTTSELRVGTKILPQYPYCRTNKGRTVLQLQAKDLLVSGASSRCSPAPEDSEDTVHFHFCAAQAQRASGSVETRCVRRRVVCSVRVV